MDNLCPNAGNAQWCPTVGGTNQYGFAYHFDIMAQSKVFGDNAVVEAEPIPCPGQAATDWEQCVCYGQTASDDTPVGIAAAAAPVVPAPAVDETLPTTLSTVTRSTAVQQPTPYVAPEGPACPAQRP